MELSKEDQQLLEEHARVKRSGFREEKTVGTSTMEAKSAKTIRELLGMADEELVIYGNPPPAVRAEFTDGGGNIYRGTLYLVTDEQKGQSRYEHGR